jgi:hypothetical protein
LPAVFIQVCEVDCQHEVVIIWFAGVHSTCSG